MITEHFEEISGTQIKFVFLLCPKEQVRAAHHTTDDHGRDPIASVSLGPMLHSSQAKEQTQELDLELRLKFQIRAKVRHFI